ncbi:hypothetical protein BDP27DRAFT_1428287 [Rhodocollybia butyracea]|uniref:Uncharacterized protein n=1 Tax=Rhodocollybia butyracea TaxID=206335 RepID=A0A9P5PET4_9AGAR|nr:hypothetical protein BDP27DRAFT_1428287 [Rhodocollybia butyracea]
MVVSCPVHHLAERALPPPPLSVLLAHTDLPTIRLQPLLAHTDLSLSGPQRSASKQARVHPYRIPTTSPENHASRPLAQAGPANLTRRPSSPLTTVTSDDEDEILDRNVSRLGSVRPIGIGHETLDALRGRMGWSEEEFEKCRKKLKLLIEKNLPPLSFTNQETKDIKMVKDKILKECPRFLEQEDAWGLDNLIIRACKNHYDKNGEAYLSTLKDPGSRTRKAREPKPKSN